MTLVTVTRRVSMYRASNLGRVVAQGTREYGAVTVSEEGADWVLTAPAEFISARNLFGPTIAEENADEAEERRSASLEETESESRSSETMNAERVG